MEKIQAVIVGLGRIASLLEDDALREKPCTHAGAIASNPDCVLAAGSDTDAARRRLFAERWKVPVYSDAAEMFSAVRPRLAVIATHPESHYFYCRLAAASGVPVLVCEKPLADTLREAKKIAALAGSPGAARGVTIITNHERRYSGDYIRAKELLESEALGKLLSVRAVLSMGKSKRLLDVFWHDGTHLADAVMFLSGAVLKHRRQWGASLSSPEGTAWLEGELRKEESPEAPVPFVMEIGAGRDHLVFEMEFSSERGRLRIGNGVFEIWESSPSPYAEKFNSLKQTCGSFSGPTGYFANMIRDAVHCAREPGSRPRSSARDGLRVIEYLHSVRAWR